MSHWYESYFRKEMERQNQQFIFGLSKFRPADRPAKSVLRDQDWNFGEEIIDITQIHAVRSSTILMNEKPVDPILESAADFLNVQNGHLVTEILKNHTAEFETFKDKNSNFSDIQTAMSDTNTISDRDTKSAKVRKRKIASDAYRAVWNKIYSKIQKLQKSKEMENSENSKMGQTTSNIPDKYNFMRSYQMLGLQEQGDGMQNNYDFMNIRDKERDVSILSGVFLSYLHLRHLDLRNLQYSTLKHLNYLVSVSRNCDKMIQNFELIASGN